MNEFSRVFRSQKQVAGHDTLARELCGWIMILAKKIRNFGRLEFYDDSVVSFYPSSSILSSIKNAPKNS